MSVSDFLGRIFRRPIRLSQSSGLQPPEKRYEQAILFCTAVLGIGLTVAHLFGWLGMDHSWFSDHIAELTLMLLAFFVLAYAARPPPRSDEWSQAIVHRLDSLQGTQVNTFEKAEDLYYYVAMKVRNAAETIDDITWGTRNPFRSEAERKAYDTYLEAMTEACHKPRMVYREISSLSDFHYYERAKKLMAIDSLSYNLAYYDTSQIDVPLVAYMIVDRKEVVGWFYRDPTGLGQTREVYVTITHKEVVKLFTDYYETLWGPAKRIRENGNIDSRLFAQVGDRLRSEADESES